MSIKASNGVTLEECILGAERAARLYHASADMLEMSDAPPLSVGDKRHAARYAATAEFLRMIGKGEMLGIERAIEFVKGNAEDFNSEREREVAEDLRDLLQTVKQEFCEHGLQSVYPTGTGTRCEVCGAHISGEMPAGWNNCRCGKPDHHGKGAKP